MLLRNILIHGVLSLRPKLTTIEKAQLNEAVEKQIQLGPMLPELETKDADGSEVSLQKEMFVKIDDIFSWSDADWRWMPLTFVLHVLLFISPISYLGREYQFEKTGRNPGARKCP